MIQKYSGYYPQEHDVVVFSSPSRRQRSHAARWVVRNGTKSIPAAAAVAALVEPTLCIPARPARPDLRGRGASIAGLLCLPLVLLLVNIVNKDTRALPTPTRKEPLSAAIYYSVFLYPSASGYQSGGHRPSPRDHPAHHLSQGRLGGGGLAPTRSSTVGRCTRAGCRGARPPWSTFTVSLPGCFFCQGDRFRFFVGTQVHETSVAPLVCVPVGVQHCHEATPAFDVAAICAHGGQQSSPVRLVGKQKGCLLSLENITDL